MRVPVSEIRSPFIKTPLALLVDGVSGNAIRLYLILATDAFYNHGGRYTRMRIDEMAKMMNVSRSTVTRLLKELEERFIERVGGRGAVQTIYFLQPRKVKWEK